MNTDSLQSIVLAVAQVQSIEAVLRLIVEGLARQPGVVLASIWLKAEGGGDLLRVAACEGRAFEAREELSRGEGEFCHFPPSEGEVVRIGATGESILLGDVSRDAGWAARHEWARREGVRSFAGHPLVFRGEVLGVLAVYSRAPLGEEESAVLRAYADHAAVAIANARAFDEINRLRQRLELENTYLREEVREALAFDEIVGRSAPLQKMLRQIELVAQTETSVLITGESGTGKELVARAIHERSTRAARPLVRVNCGSIPSELFESEFFGHARGAFTGAVRERAGRFQLADGGTLFLDEVGEIPLFLQPKLLRVLQEGQYERVGEDRTRTVDVRIVAATNRDLRREIEEGRFRPDLFYRLSVFPVEVPPLRERREDIPLLAAHFIRRSCRQLNCAGIRLTDEHVSQLQEYDWPGNIRELQNVIERAVILSQGGPLKLELSWAGGGARAAAQPAPGGGGADTFGPSGRVIAADEWRRMERGNILRALEQAGHKIYGRGGAAELLGLRPTTLASRMKALGISRDSRFRAEGAG